MRSIWIKLALGLFRADLAVKREIEVNPKLDCDYMFCNDRIRLTRFYNYGTAGSRFKGHMPAIIRCSGLMTFGCAGMLLRLLCKKGCTMQKLGFSLMSGGALSNLYDRCKRGYVVDYISFRTPWKWLSSVVFNLSDFLIFTGAVFICLGQTDHIQR